MNAVCKAYHVLQTLGPGWVLFRLGYALRKKAGLLRRATPTIPWDQILAPAVRLLPAPAFGGEGPKPGVAAEACPPRWVTGPSGTVRTTSSLLTSAATLDCSIGADQAGAIAGAHNCVDEAEAVLRGKFRLFSHHVVGAGFPPDWHRNQIEAISDQQSAVSGQQLAIREKISNRSCLETKSKDCVEGAALSAPLVPDGGGAPPSINKGSRLASSLNYGSPAGERGDSVAGQAQSVPLLTPRATTRDSESGSDGVLPHWSEIADFGAGDIKGVWELSRFPWAFALARAYARTHDPRYADAFWRLFEDWCRHNPPNLGPNWMCGQEATFRLMAVIFAAEVLKDSSVGQRAGARPETGSTDRPPAGTQETSRDSSALSEDRRLLLTRFIVATGRRIAANLDYALSQKNNHGVSECVGLITAGLAVPKHPESADWITRGLRELETQLAELVYEDGGFSQHSLIYHRVLLHDLCWCRSRLVGAGRSVPGWLDDAGRRALDFLIALVDPETGLAPLYGSNDGANILPLADADFLDLRPTIQAAASAFRGELALPAGTWDEAALWLNRKPKSSGSRRSGGLSEIGGDAAPSPSTLLPPLHSLDPLDHSTTSPLPSNQPPITDSPPSPIAHRPSPNLTHSPPSGLLLWKNGPTRLFLRCPERFRHRPCQADMLHVDVWRDGLPITRDAGTFSYNTTGRFGGAMKEAAVHNTVSFDGQEPLTKVGRFLYLPWPKGSALWDGQKATFEATHDGWQRLGITHVRRIMTHANDGFVVEDRVEGTGAHSARLHWLLADAAHDLRDDRIDLRTTTGLFTVRWEASAAAVSLVRADPATNRGWWSPYYHHAAPALSLAIDFRFTGTATVRTFFEPS